MRLVRRFLCILSSVELGYTELVQLSAGWPALYCVFVVLYVVVACYYSVL